MRRKHSVGYGDRFNHWKVISPEFKVGIYYFVLAECDCGEVHRVRVDTILSKASRQCVRCRNEIHGQYRLANEKGLDKAPEYGSWRNMINRGRGKGPYRERGIEVCDRWKEPGKGFINFLQDMGKKPGVEYSIDRIDNEGNYEPSNCRWATRQDQARNTRANLWITFHGQTLCAKEWSEITGIKHITIIKRYHRGLSPEKILSTTPLYG